MEELKHGMRYVSNIEQGEAVGILEIFVERGVDQTECGEGDAR